MGTSTARKYPVRVRRQSLAKNTLYFDHETRSAEIQGWILVSEMLLKDTTLVQP